jgi:hypothetical protein
MREQRIGPGRARARVRRTGHGALLKRDALTKLGESPLEVAYCPKFRHELKLQT